jgi:hypothetical protein
MSILPAAGQTTQIDVTDFFELYAAWQFRDGSIYTLGETTYSVRFQGTISNPSNGGDPTFTSGPNNAINNGTSVSLVNLQPITQPPIAYNQYDWS